MDRVFWCLFEWQQWYEWAEIPAEGLQQLWDHGGQFVQTDQCVLWWQRPSHRLRALHSVRVKAQSFEPFYAEMWQKTRKPLGVMSKQNIFTSLQDIPTASLLAVAWLNWVQDTLFTQIGSKKTTFECQVTLQQGKPGSWYSRGCKTNPHLVHQIWIDGFQW